MSRPCRNCCSTEPRTPRGECRACVNARFRAWRSRNPLGSRPKPIHTCRKCGSSDRYERNGDCKPCAVRRASEWHARRRLAPGATEFQANKTLVARLRKYGLSRSEFDRMLGEQEGLCAICRTEPAAHIDHDHYSGLVRGVLCFACNAGIGQFREDIRRMALASAYLQAWTACLISNSEAAQ